MVKYYLSVKKKGSINPIEKVNYELNGSLKDIDEFTSSCNNENELKEEIGQLYGINLDGKITISYKIKRNGEEKEYELTPFYKNGYKYMLDENGMVSPKKIRDYILGKLGDFTFLSKLASFYYIPSKNAPQNSNYYSIMNYINGVNSSEINRTIYNEFNIGIRDLIERETKKENGEINYVGLRRLVMFVIKYNEKLKLDKFRNQVEIIKEEYIPKRFQNYADVENYPGDLELGYRGENSSYITEDEEFTNKR